jgi:DNA-binding HxlR family transcriptional regulator
MARRHRNNTNPGCSVEATLALIDGKWKGVILHHLRDEKMRFSAFRRLMPNVTQRMLTNQLRELEADGLISRTVYAEVPPRVDYALTELGRTLEPVLESLRRWGDAHGWPDETQQADAASTA